MTRSFWALLLCLVLARPVQADTGPASDWLIRLPADETVERFIAQVRAIPELDALVRRATPLALPHWLRLRLNATVDAETLHNMLAPFGAVAIIEPNRRWHLVATLPNDPDFAQQWGLRNTGQPLSYPQDPADGYSVACDSQPDDGIAWCDLDPVSDTAHASQYDIDADLAWDKVTGSVDVRIGIVDSGVDPRHPDLIGRIWRPAPGDMTDPTYGAAVYGWDACDGDGEPEDLVGHGTQVAAIAGAAGNDGAGISGVAWVSRIVVAKALGAERFDPDSSCNLTSAAIEALEFVRQAGVDVVNLSWGGPEPSQALLEKLQQLAAEGIVIVAAAGNDAKNIDEEPFYPASWSIPGMVVVTAHTNDGRLASFANVGQKVDLAAPGVAIRTALPGRIDAWSERNFNGYTGKPGRLSPGAIAGTDFRVSGDHWAIAETLTGDKIIVGDYDAVIRSPAEAHTGPWTQRLTSEPLDAAAFGRATLYVALYHDLGPGSSVKLQYSTNSASSADPSAVWKDIPGDAGTFTGYGAVERFLDFGSLLSPLPSSLSIRFVMTTAGNWAGSDSPVQGGLQIAAVRWWKPAENYADGRAYDLVQGTSMAAPFATGVAALVRATDAELAPATIVSAMSVRSRTLPQIGDASRIAGGHMLNAARAVDDAPLLVWLGEAPFLVSGAVPNPVSAAVPVSFAARLIGEVGEPSALAAAVAWKPAGGGTLSWIPASVNGDGEVRASGSFSEPGVVEWRFAVTEPVSGFEIPGEPSEWQELLVYASATSAAADQAQDRLRRDRKGCGCHSGPPGSADEYLLVLIASIWLALRRRTV